MDGSYALLLISFTIITVAIFYTSILTIKTLDINDAGLVLNTFLFVLYGILLICVCFVFNVILVKETKIKNKSIRLEHDRVQLEQLQQYTEKMENHYQELRKFKHDYRNILLGLSEFIREEDMVGLKNYYENIIDHINEEIENNDTNIGQLKNVHVREIKGLLASKLEKARQESIMTFVEVIVPIYNIHMNVLKMCRILGILVDNAIEEAQLCNAPELRIALLYEESSLSIIVANTCRKNIPSQEKIFKRGFSTKGKGRGLGLSNLEEIISETDNLTIETIVEDGIFLQKLEVFKKGEE